MVKEMKQDTFANRLRKAMDIRNFKQIDLVNKANASLKNANYSLNNGIPIDMIETDLKACFDYLGQIIGDTYEQAVIDRLFRDFCVGK